MRPTRIANTQLSEVLVFTLRPGVDYPRRSLGGPSTLTWPASTTYRSPARPESVSRQRPTNAAGRVIRRWSRAEALWSRLVLEGPLRLNPSRALRSDLRASALGAGLVVA